MSWPSTISTFTNPTANQKLNSPSHSSIHTQENTAISEIQTFVGTLSSAVGTLVHDIRAAASNGGGHVQTANKGGTGQTAYTTGDTLIATSSSVLSKLAIGLDGQVLTADSSVAGKVKWATNPATFSNKIAVSGSVFTVGVSTVAESSLINVTIPGSTLGINNAIRATLFLRTLFNNSSSSVLLNANYGSQNVASVLIFDSSTGNLPGKIIYNLIGNQSSSTQAAHFDVDLKNNYPHFGTSIFGINVLSHGLGTVDSGANQPFGITSRFSASDASNAITVEGYTVEKIA